MASNNFLTIVSANVRGLREENKRKTLFKLLKSHNADVICLQETHMIAEDLLIWEKQWGNNIYYSPGTTNSRGVLITFNPRHKDNTIVTHIKHDSEGRFLSMMVDIKDVYAFVLTNLYAPNVDNPEFFEQKFRIIDQHQVLQRVTVGDMNIALNPKLDRSGHTDNKINPYATDKLNKLLELYGYSDTWRTLNPDTKKYSWSRAKPKFSGSRLDYIFMDVESNSRTTSIEYCKGHKSDHYMVKAVLKVHDQDRGPGYWKFNNTLLYDERFTSEATLIIKKYSNSKLTINPEDKWELLKNELIQWAQLRSRVIARQKKQRLKDIESETEHVVTMLSNDTSNSTLISRLCDLELERDHFLENKTQSCIFRSKAKWIQEGEKPSKYFFSLEKQNYCAKVIRELQVADTTVNDPQDILNAQFDYYSDLYASNPEVEFRLTNTGDCKIMKCDHDMLERPITKEELRSSLFDMKLNKSPGIDGLTVEFYQYFWHEIDDLYHSALMRALDMNQLHLSARKGIISLLPKKNRNLKLLKNWRPLTMLSIDYKILAKTLATRLKQVLPYLISMDQTGFMEGRQITNTIRKTIDIIQYCEKHNQKGYILNLDYEKAFDRLELTAIIGSLKYFDIGTNFCNWVSILLSNFISSTTNNGYISPEFDVTRSCRQGCNLSPYLYLLCAETIAIEVRKNSNIQGIKIQDLENIISQFADDTQLFSENEQTIETIVHLLYELEHNTGLKVNYEKSSIHPVGGAKKPEQLSQNFVWDPGGVNVLGINTADNGISVFMEIFEKVKSVAKSWVNRQISLTGKVLLVNSLMASLFTYKMQVTDTPPPAYFKQYDRIIESFLWSNKRPKIKTDILKAKHKFGGLNLVDLNLKCISLKIPWIFRNGTFSEHFINMHIPQELGSYFWDCSLSTLDLGHYVHNVSTFWYQVVECWFYYKRQKTDLSDPIQVAQTILWLNSDIRINHTPVMYNNFVRHGIMYVQDIWSFKWGRWLTVNELSVEYAFDAPWYEYQQLISAIPKTWPRLLKTCETVPPWKPSLYDHLNSNVEKIARHVYHDLAELRNPIDSLTKKLSKWIILTQEELSTAYRNIHQLTNITKYRDFQYRLLCSDIHLNDRLFHWGIKSTNKCDYCVRKQTVAHFFVDCPVIQTFFKHFCEFISVDIGYPASMCDLTLKTILLNTLHPHPSHLVNFLLLVAKNYIYCSKCKNKNPRFRHYLHKILEIQKLEYYNAKNKNKLSRHTSKWAPFFPTLGVHTLDEENDDNIHTTNIEEFINRYIYNL